MKERLENLNRKKLLEKIKKEMPNDLNEKEKAAFIMMKIAEDRSFSEHYLWGSPLKQRKIYSEAVDPTQVETENKRKLICVTSSRLFKYIATEMGLKVWYMSEDLCKLSSLKGCITNREHIYPVVELADGSLIKCDIQYDLPNIQTGCRWEGFGTIYPWEKDILSVISEEELETIMERIGYLRDKNRDKYTDDYCREQIEGMKTTATVTEVVRTVFEDERLNGEVSHTNIIETYKFYKRIMRIFLGEETKATIPLLRYMQSFYMFPCRIKKDGNIRYTLCSYTVEEDGDGIIYLLSRTNKRMIPITLEELANFEKQGLKIPKSGTYHLRRRLNDFRISRQEISNTKREDYEEFIDEEADERELF